MKRNEDMLAIGGKTFIDEVFESNLKERKIYLNQGVDENMVEVIIAQILKFNSEDKFADVIDRKPILLYINCLGGDALNGLNMCDVIKNSKTPIYGIVLSYAYSMGAVVFQACHKRYMFENSSMLIHDGSTAMSGSSNKVKDLKKFYDKIDGIIKRIIISKSTVSSDEYDDNMDREWYLLSDECKEKGFCDLIVGIDVDTDEVI